MSDWFLVSVWYENGDTQVHFEIANEDGEQYFFWLNDQLISDKLTRKGGSSLDKFYYYEEDMLALAVTILDEEMIDEMEAIEINSRWFERYF